MGLGRAYKGRERSCRGPLLVPTTTDGPTSARGIAHTSSSESLARGPHGRMLQAEQPLPRCCQAPRFQSDNAPTDAENKRILKLFINAIES